MTNSREWSVREATEADDSELADLFKTVFGFDRGSEHSTWKYRTNPSGAPIIAVAIANEKIVGQYALWPTPIKLGNKVYKGAQSLDTMTHPSYRGQGMFTVLAEACMKYAEAKGIEVLYGFPNENSQPGFIRRLDWDLTGYIPMWFRPLNISSHKRFPKWIGPLGDFATLFLPKGTTRGFDIRLGMPNANEMDLLLGKWNKNTQACSIDRSADRFIWRFDRASGMQYEWISTYLENCLVSIGVWGIDLRTGNAVMAELVGENHKAIVATAATMLARARTAGCPLMHVVSSRSQIVKALKQCGFIQRSQLPLIIRKLTTKTLAANVHTHENWEIFGADLDTF